MSDTDFAKLIEPVARHFWGEHNPKLSSKTELRWGGQGSRAVFLDGPGNWKDFEADIGGGVIDLVMLERKCSKAEAIAWLEGEHFIPKRDSDRRDAPQRQDRSQADNGPAEQESQPVDKPQAQMKAVKGYRYTDADGNPLYEVIRYQFLLPDGSFEIDAKTGNPKKTFRQRRPDGRGGYIWNLDGIGHTIYRHQEVEQAIERSDLIVLCYSPDTEVLTPDGWVAFPDLQPGTQVAQYDLATESVSFTTPKAHQRYRYVGEMVNIKAAWCDLLVTPDHRQPRRNVRFNNGGEFPFAPSIAPASTIRYGHQLPASGIKRNGKPIELTAARLLVAWLGDGVWEPRGEQVSWNLKKERKQERLRAALAVLGIQWTEHQYPSTPGWTSFRVAKSDIRRHIEIGPDKRWSWEMLDWSADARGAALDELQYWDGDGQSDISSRFFTGERQSADVVCALAATTGYHANLRIDRREGKNDSYVVNLNHKTWRQISRTPERVPYDGEVFCCTVDTGILVVRRNGKVTISGNCEGEKDVETLEALGFTATTNSGGAQHWTDEMAKHLAGADVVLLPDNDDAGRAGAQKKAESLKAYAKSVRILDLARYWDAPPKSDVSDWVAAGGTAEALTGILAGTTRPRPPKSSFGAQTSGTIARKPVVYDWLVKHLIERNGIMILAGESMAGKTFLVMDMGMKIARGLDYAGHKTRQGAVIHMAVEDGKGTELRFKGCLKAQGISPDADIPYVVMDPFANGGTGFTLMDDECVDRFIKECLDWKEYYGSLEFIIIDTLSMATEGMDENSSGEASKVLGRINRIRERTGATVAVVHHMNAGGTKVRGSTALVANVPNVIELKQQMIPAPNKREEPKPALDGNGQPIRRARLAKNKNGVGNKSWAFVLEQVTLNELDEDGEPFTTMVCARPAKHNHNDQPEDVTRLQGGNKLVFDALVAAQADHGQDMPAGVEAGSVTKCVAQSALVAQVRKRMSFKAPEDEPEQRQKELADFLSRTTMALINAGYMGRDNDKRIVWWTGRSDRPRPPRQMEQERPQEQPGAGIPEDVKREIADDPVPF